MGKLELELGRKADVDPKYQLKRKQTNPSLERILAPGWGLLGPLAWYLLLLFFRLISAKNRIPPPNS